MEGMDWRNGSGWNGMEGMTVEVKGQTHPRNRPPALKTRTVHCAKKCTGKIADRRLQDKDEATSFTVQAVAKASPGAECWPGVAGDYRFAELDGSDYTPSDCYQFEAVKPDNKRRWQNQP